MFKNPTLLMLALVMLVNALSYGTIIPLLYPYASRFGINAFSLSLLFISYSLFQFIATPIIGRLSDKYGRKPLLLLSLGGTSLSLALFASATTVPMLFIARIMDGITGGNMSVAQAVI
ncbi:MAG TPA: MFS transporter, partial [Patescibacteria group bacterium]